MYDEFESLPSHKDYMARFWEIAQDDETSRRHENAFISLESELRSKYGVRRYTTYVSFRVGKHRAPRRAKYTPFK